MVEHNHDAYLERSLLMNHLHVEYVTRSNKDLFKDCGDCGVKQIEELCYRLSLLDEDIVDQLTKERDEAEETVCELQNLINAMNDDEGPIQNHPTPLTLQEQLNRIAR